MKQQVTITWAKTLYELTVKMESLVKDGWTIGSFQIFEKTLGYDAVVVLNQEDTDEG